MKTSEKLAKLLQASFPEHNGLALTWRAEWLYPAKGAYRSGNIDCYRWSGAANHVREDGTRFCVLFVGSYYTMTELAKAKRLYMSESGEIGAEEIRESAKHIY